MDDLAEETAGRERAVGGGCSPFADHQGGTKVACSLRHAYAKENTLMPRHPTLLPLVVLVTLGVLAPVGQPVKTGWAVTGSASAGSASTASTSAGQVLVTVTS